MLRSRSYSASLLVNKATLELPLLQELPPPLGHWHNRLTVSGQENHSTGQIAIFSSKNVHMTSQSLIMHTPAQLPRQSLSSGSIPAPKFEISDLKFSDFNLQVEGNITDTVRVVVPLDAHVRSRISFRHMDPCALAPDIGEFDAVFITNVLERIASPKAPLTRMGGPCPIVKEGGVVVVASTCDWKEKVSSSQLWLSGVKDTNGERVRLSGRESFPKHQHWNHQNRCLLF